MTENEAISVDGHYNTEENKNSEREVNNTLEGEALSAAYRLEASISPIW